MQIEDSSKQLYSSTLSSTEMIKKNLVDLLFQCTVHKSKSFNEEDKYAFCAKVEDLSAYLLRYTPPDKQKELFKWWEQMKEEVKEIGRSKDTGTDKKERILGIRYEYALEVHEHNARILFNSPLIEIEMEGNINPTELEEHLEVVRKDVRDKDDPIISKF